MTIAIVGSRTFNDYSLLERYMDTLCKGRDFTAVVSGGARGADSLGARWAMERGLELIELKADWKKYGRSAGFRRNHDIINTCDECVAFWDGQSHGTKHDIDLCNEQGKKVHICYFRPETA